MKKTSLLFKSFLIVGLFLSVFKVQAQDNGLVGFSYYILFHTEGLLSHYEVDSIQKYEHLQKKESSVLFNEIYFKQGELWNLYAMLPYVNDSAVLYDLKADIGLLADELAMLNAEFEKVKSDQELERAAVVINLAIEGLTSGEIDSIENDFVAYQAEKEARYNEWLQKRDSLRTVWEAEKEKREAERDSLKVLWKEKEDSIKALWVEKMAAEKALKDSIAEAWREAAKINKAKHDSLVAVYQALSQDQKDSIKTVWEKKMHEQDSVRSAFFMTRKAQYELFVAFKDSVVAAVADLPKAERDSIIKAELGGIFFDSEVEPAKKVKRCYQRIDVKVFPNPTMGAVTVESDSEIVSISVIDSNNLVILETNDSEIEIDGRAGTYILQIETEDGTVLKKVFKQ